MKVGELKEGMLVQASGNWEIVDSRMSADGQEIGITVNHAWKRIAKKEIMMFVGTTQDDFRWCGVKRHHRFLWKGRGVIMTGYDMRYLEPVEEGERE
jgi:hypothetical protein